MSIKFMQQQFFFDKRKVWEEGWYLEHTNTSLVKRSLRMISQYTSQYIHALVIVESTERERELVG